MSNYQRLIAYIYTYEGGIKGKNIGFAKLETRNIQCKITVNVKKIFVGGNPMGVYLLSNQGELRIGTLFARNGAGEFRATVNAANVEDSGRGVEEFYGLTVHDVESAWRAYTTIWEDAVAHSAEVELADVTAEKLKKKQAQEEVQELPISKEIEKELALEEKRNEEKKLEAELALEEKLKEENIINRGKWRREGAGIRESLMQFHPPVTAAAELVPPVRETGRLEWISNTEVQQNKEPARPWQKAPEPEKQSQQTNKTPDTQSNIDPNIDPYNESNNELNIDQNNESNNDRNNDPNTDPNTDLNIEPDISQPADFIPTPKEENEARTHQEMWEMLRKKFAKILAFDYEDGCEILTIKPQDIGLLPRENWVYGNNSFLLHGYYNYRYLIMARLENPNGIPRYLLGVPGNYFSNEKYMAAMFTFSDFVLSKKQPSQDSRFGYWYTDIKIGE